MPQHPDPSPVDGTQVGQRFMVIPTASCPSATSRAAATALSTPPLIATATRAIPVLGPPQEGVALHALPPGPETAPHLVLVAGGRGLVIGAILHVVRDVLLRDERSRVIVRVLIPAPVLQSSRPRIGRVPQVAGHGTGLFVLGVMPGPRDRRDRRVALRRGGEIDR